MTFENGFPKGDSIKLPLYLIEPEQLSDLVAVPRSNVQYWNIRLITYDNNPRHKSDYDIQSISFPLDNVPCLFQRYNPYGLPFADGYSTKLYEWKLKYSHLVLARTTDLLKINSYQNRQPLLLSFNIGTKLKVKLPNNNKRIDLSYYYPELTDKRLLLASSFSDFGYLEPEDIADWRTALTPAGRKPNSRKLAYIFSRIDNECITVPATRSWLLRFETFYCKGQEIEIDEDILVASLRIDYSELTQIEIDEIETQIPECYFYRYLDTFFQQVDELIFESNPDIFNLRQARKVKYTLDIDYQIDHYQNSIENVVYRPPVQYRGQTYDEDSYLTYERDPQSKYILWADTAFEPNIEFLDRVKISDSFKFGAIYYANNNYWNNYNFQLEDLGYVHLDRGDKLVPNSELRFITFNYLGNQDRTNSSQEYVGRILNSNVKERTTSLINTFYKNPRDFGEDGYVDAFCLEKELYDRSPEIHNNYFAWLLYDDCTNFPRFDLKLGNFLKVQAYSVDNNNNSSNYFVRYNVSKLFLCKFDISLTSWNYRTIDINRSSSTNSAYSFDNESELIELGEVDFTFDKYGEPHPDSKTVLKTSNNWTYIPNTYYQGQKRNTRFETSSSFLLAGNYRISDRKSGGRNEIEFIGDTRIIELDKYSIGRDTSFQRAGRITKEFVAVLTPTDKLKTLRKYDFESQAFDFIYEAHQNCYMANTDLEEIKKQVREIHLALDAQKFAYQDPDEDTSRVANLGYYIERLARILGISVNADGSLRSIRQSKRVESGDTIPAGWSLGQWARNNGGSSNGQTGGNADSERDGMAWEIRSNNFKNDDFTGETNAIEQGGYALVENFPQLLHIILADLDRAFGLQDAGANVLPTPNGNQIANYQGMNAMLLDVLYTLGQLSKQISSTNILTMKNQAMIQELMAGTGLPVTIQELEINAGSGNIGKLPFPGFAPNAPTLQDLHSLTNLNLATLIGAKLEAIADEENSEDNSEEPPTEGESNP